MRVCQPGPVDLQRAMTLAGKAVNVFARRPVGDVEHDRHSSISAGGGEPYYSTGPAAGGLARAVLYLRPEFLQFART